MHLRQSRGRWAWDATPSMSEKKGEDAGRDAVSASLFERGLAGHAATGRIELGESVDRHGPTATLTLLRTPGARQNLPVGRRADTSGLTPGTFRPPRAHTPRQETQGRSPRHRVLCSTLLPRRRLANRTFLGWHHGQEWTFTVMGHVL